LEAAMWQTIHSITAVVPVTRKQPVNTPMFIILNFCIALTVIQVWSWTASGCTNIKAYDNAHHCTENIAVEG